MSETCGVVTIGGTGIEWVCIRPPHDTAYQRRTGDRTHERGTYVMGTGARPDTGHAAQADRHYMVRRYPHREATT